MPDHPGRGASIGEELELWEERLIETVVAGYDTFEREDLAAELAWRLLVLKRQRGPEIRNWRAYVSKFLHNKSSNWIRKTRPRERSTISLDAPVGSAEDDETLGNILASSEPDAHRDLAVKRALNELSPKLRGILQILIEENWNQFAASRRVGKHRNTIRSWIRKIRQTLISHGLGTGLGADKAVVKSGAGTIGPIKPIKKQGAFMTVSNSVLNGFNVLRLAGAEWRLALWVLCRSFTQKRNTVAVSWRSIARTLTMDHAGVRRAGMKLMRSGVLFAIGQRIGFERNISRWRFEERWASRRSSAKCGDKTHRFRPADSPALKYRHVKCASLSMGGPKSDVKTNRFIRIPKDQLETLLRVRLSGIQWSILFWVICQTVAIKRNTTPFSWYRIAATLVRDRSGIVRASSALLRTGILFLEGKTIGVRQVSANTAIIPKSDPANL